MTLSVWKTSTREHNWIIGIIFLYFLVLSGDLLEISVGTIGIKLSRFFGCVLLSVLVLSNRFRILERKLFFCFLGILSSFVISSFFSCHFSRSIGSAGAGLFTYVCFFLVPLNLMFLFDREKILRLYLLSFAMVGIHALSQFLLSFLGIIEPFVTQRAGITAIARGQSWTYEPSYYALFAIPFVVYLNTRYLLREEGLSIWKVLGANLLLLISTSTGGFFSYFIFFATCLFLSLFVRIKHAFPALRARAGKFFIGFAVLLCSAGLIMIEMFLHTFYKFFYIGFLTHWSFMERWEKIVEGWKVFCSSPLFGVGLRGFEELSYRQAHFNSAHVPIYGPIDTREMFMQYTPSNVFMEILSTLGMYGLCAFVLLGVVVWQMFYTAVQDDRLPVKERKRILAFFVSLIVMCVCLQFNQELFRNYVWVHMGICVGYLLSVRTEFAN